MLDEILHLFYPRVCAGCAALLVDSEQEICRTCLASFDRFPDADAADFAVQEVFRRNCPEGECPQKAWVLYRFHKGDRLQKVIHSMKYGGEYRLGKVFGGLLAEMIAGSTVEIPYDCIVPVPLHRMKGIERTYNQSAVIARCMGRVLGKKVGADLVVRERHTRSQAGLSPGERKVNVHDAFAPSGKRVPENILLVDDVLTTGSTVAAVMHSLRSAGARHISLATVALAA